MGSKYKVVILDHRFPNVEIQRKILSEIGAELVVGQGGSEEDMIALAKDADAVLAARSKVTEKVINGLERCKVIVRYGIGVDTVDVPAATRKGIMVSNVLDHCIDEVSDHALALILCLGRKVVFSAGRVRSGEWTVTNLNPIKRLTGQTVGVVGLGRIGRVLARKAMAIGFEVLAFDPYVNTAEAAEEGLRLVSFETLLSESDYLSLHAPLTPQTEGLIGAREFEKMKPTACIVNVSRGPLIDESALIAALEQKRIAGAGLDVLCKEPPDPGNPLLHMEQVIVTSHTAFYSDESMEELQEKAAQKVVDALCGRTPRPLVNPEVLAKTATAG